MFWLSALFIIREPFKFPMGRWHRLNTRYTLVREINQRHNKPFICNRNQNASMNHLRFQQVTHITLKERDRQRQTDRDR